MYQSGEIRAKLQRILDYLGQQTYGEYMGGTGCVRPGRIFSYPTLGQWYNAIGEARNIVKDAIKSFDRPAVIEVIVVDLDAFERRLIAASIPDSDVVGLLPYQATVGEGDTYMHVVNESKYNVNTNAHSIPAGEALCGRGINDGKTIGNTYRGTGRFPVVPTCPGCLAKAKNQIAYHLQQKAQAGELR